jgi:HTH-type transcriptional regulator/antitoxin HipB
MGDAVNQVRTPTDIGALARAGRIARGWNQQQAANAAGVSRRFVNMVEGGQHRGAELWRVLALLDALGVELKASLPAITSVTARITRTASGAAEHHEPVPPEPEYTDGVGS